MTVQPRTLKVTIPAGVIEGQRIRLAGQGSPGIGGGPPGDLYLEIGFKPHRLFAVDGRDLTLTLPIAPWEAALGATVQTPTLAGPVDLRIPPNAKAGQKMRLKGRGLPGATVGDQYVVLKLVQPLADTPRAKEIYEQMQRELPFDPRNGSEWESQSKHRATVHVSRTSVPMRASSRYATRRGIAKSMCCFSMKSAAPSRIASTAARTSVSSPSTITGGEVSSARSRRNRSSPDMPGSHTSVIKQPSVSRADAR